VPQVIKQHRGGPGTEHVEVIDAVCTGQHAAQHSDRFGATVGCTGPVTVKPYPLIDGLSDAEALGQHSRGDQAGVGHQIVLVKGHGDGGEVV
jgi:hypothetical protein